MLLGIKKFLMEKHAISLGEVARYFHQQPETMRCMLAHWVRKGKVIQVPKSPDCGTKCQLCSVVPKEVYKWVG